MEIRQVKSDWFVLKSEADDQVTLTFFGYSKDEVIGKFRKWVRAHDMIKIRSIGR